MLNHFSTFASCTSILFFSKVQTYKNRLRIDWDRREADLLWRNSWHNIYWFWHISICKSDTQPLNQVPGFPQKFRRCLKVLSRTTPLLLLESHIHLNKLYNNKIAILHSNLYLWQSLISLTMASTHYHTFFLFFSSFFKYFFFYCNYSSS